MKAGQPLQSAEDPGWDAEAALAVIERTVAPLRGVVPPKHLRMAGVTLRLEFASQAMADLILPPFRHLLDDAPSEPVATIFCWDSRSTGTRFPRELRDPEAIQRYALTCGLRGDRLMASLRRSDFGLTLYDRQAKQGYYWVADALEAPYRDDGNFYGAGNPLRGIFSWIFADLGWAMVHAGAVGADGAAVLLAGGSGAGKSTTAVRCLEAGMDFLADDMVLIGPEPPTAASVYATAKVFREGHPGRPASLAPGPAGALHEFDKEIRFVQPGPRQLPLVAVAPVRVTGCPESRFVPCSRREAFAILAPGSLLLMPGANHVALRTMRRVVEAVPAFWLEVGSDPAGVAPAVRALIEHARNLIGGSP